MQALFVLIDVDAGDSGNIEGEACRSLAAGHRNLGLTLPLQQFALAPGPERADFGGV